MPNEKEETKLITNAGHADCFSFIELEDSSQMLGKQTNLIEAIAYLELLLLGCNHGEYKFLPDLYKIIIYDNQGNTILNTEDILEKIKDPDQLKPTITTLTSHLRHLHMKHGDDLKAKIFIELLKDSSQENIENPCLDSKVGKDTFSKYEHIYNWGTLKEDKNLLNKSQMFLNEWLAREGGAENYQIANSNNIFLRQFTYYYTEPTLINYFNQLDLKELISIKLQLSSALCFIKKNHISAIGASLLYCGSKVRVIDLAHYLSPIPFITHINAKEAEAIKQTHNYNVYHQNFVDALIEHIAVVLGVIHGKSQNKKILDKQPLNFFSHYTQALKIPSLRAS
ncbi:hypothetical protein L3V86_08840 [Thiotrichales bacterium 19S11-10]|nr:hypothetical protein [Thiotrichales bacterium 19S11-10]